MRVLLVGCGALGSAIARGAVGMPGLRLSIYDQDGARARELAHETGATCPDLLPHGMEEVDLVIEAASQEALRDLVPMALGRGLTLIGLSVGALVDADLREKADRLSTEHGGRLLCPSGAVCGLDALRAAREGGLEAVELETVKPPRAVGLPEDAPRQVLFEGSADEAVRRYPRNVNVAAAVALAGIGFEKTRVRIVADPAVTRNTHTLRARGDFGELTCRVENEASPDNPASSRLASLSALALLRRFLTGVQVGT